MSKRIIGIGSLLLIFTGMNLLLASFFVVINKSIEGYLFIISFIITLPIIFFMSEKGDRHIKKTLINLLIFTIIVFGSIKISTMFYDFSYDGQSYHQEALIQLKEGWNPLYEQVALGTTQDLWINHYAKGPWYLGAIVYDLTGKIESAKTFNFILLLSTFFILVSYLRSKLKNWKLTFLISSLMVLSPVVINQIFTNYNDFFIILLIINLLVSYLMYVENPDNYILMNVFFVIILLVNIKFTALGYAIILTGIPIFIYILKIYQAKKNNVNFDHKASRLALTVFFSFFIAIIFVGNTSYVKNTLTNGHPFYPLAGDGKVDIIINNIPAGVADLNKIEKLYVSIFSETSNNLKQEPKTKFPLSISKNEVFYSGAIDTRIGGFGPLFGLIVILTFSLLLINYRTLNRKELWYFGIIVGVIMVSILINPETWWARYIPQLWIIPLIILILMLKNNIKSYLSYFILVVYSINIFIVFYQNSNNLLDKQNEIEKQFEVLKEYNQEYPLTVEFGAFKANRARLTENGISYNTVQTIEGCQNFIQLTYSTTKVCLESPIPSAKN